MHRFACFCSLRVTTAIYPVPCICRDDQISDWFDCLSTCMHWNVRQRQKPFIGIGMTPSSSSNSLCSRTSDNNGENSYQNNLNHPIFLMVKQEVIINSKWIKACVTCCVHGTVLGYQLRSRLKLKQCKCLVIKVLSFT